MGKPFSNDLLNDCDNNNDKKGGGLGVLILVAIGVAIYFFMQI